MKRIELLYFLVFLVLLIAIFQINALAGSTISDVPSLSHDLASPDNSPQDWGLQYWPAIKQRLLFRWIAQGTWSLFASSGAPGFYFTFVGISFALFYFTAIAFYFFLRELGFSSLTGFAGGLLYLSAPPVALAYKYPVYTREDPLAYLLVTLGLVAMLKRQPVWVAVLATAGAFTRETTLIVPLVYYLISKESWRNKIIACAPPLIATACIRIVLGNAVYNPLESSLINFFTPWETAAFLFCVFGLLWVPPVLELLASRKHDFSKLNERLIFKIAPFVMLLMLVATLVGSRAREIRVSFLIFPWVIPLALTWVQQNSRSLIAMLSSRVFWALQIFTLGALSFIILMLKQYPMIIRHLMDFNNGYWLALGAFNASTILAVVFYRLILKYQLVPSQEISR